MRLGNRMNALWPSYDTVIYMQMSGVIPGGSAEIVGGL